MRNPIEEQHKFSQKDFSKGYANWFISIADEAIIFGMKEPEVTNNNLLLKLQITRIDIQ